MNPSRLKQQMEIDEGRKKRIYTDTVGKVSGGIGRNLTDRGFRDSEIDLMYANDMADAEADARALVPVFARLDDVRQEVLLNMSFNLGKTRFAGFKKFLAAVNRLDFATAAAEMKDSTWYVQVGERGKRLANAMRTGAF